MGQKKNLHFSVVAFFDELKNLPKECSNIIELEGNQGKIYDKNDISGNVTEFIPQIYTNRIWKNIVYFWLISI